MSPLPDRTERVDELIGFRVECHGMIDDSKNDITSQHLLNQGSILPAHEILDSDSFFQLVENHLCWKRTPSPFASFFRTWERTLNRRNWLINQGGRNIVIIAVWLKGHQRVYDAYAIAERRFRFVEEPTTIDGNRKNLKNYKDELLVVGGIRSNENRILACFWGNSLEMEKLSIWPLLCTSRKLHRATIPMGVIPGSNDTRLGITERLQNDMIAHTGTKDVVKLCVLILAMCGCSVEMVQSGVDITINVEGMFYDDRGKLVTGKYAYLFTPENGLDYCYLLLED